MTTISLKNCRSCHNFDSCSVIFFSLVKWDNKRKPKQEKTALDVLVSVTFPKIIPALKSHKTCYIWTLINDKIQNWDSLIVLSLIEIILKIPTKVISVETVAWQNSMRLNRHEEFSRFGRVDRKLRQSIYIIF